MRCPVCGKPIRFYNVDFQGFEHCPECNARPCTEYNIQHLQEQLVKKQYMRRVEMYGDQV